MLRSILAVIVGYLTMFVLIALSFTAIHLLLGTERIFRPGSWVASNTFCILAVVISFIVAIVGGLVCALIARSPRAPIALAIVVLIFGALSAGLSFAKPDPGPRPAQVGPMDAAQNARQPAWYTLSLPIVGAAGIITGGRLRRRPAPPPAA